MTDYIKREDAVEALNRHKKTFSCGEDNSKERYAYMQHLADFKAIEDIPTADVVEVGKWCDMREYILEMQADENGHNEFFRIIKLPVIFKKQLTRNFIFFPSYIFIT